MFESHSQKVCGLKWSEDERYMTSGGADTVVNVWEHTQITEEEPVNCFNVESSFGNFTLQDKLCIKYFYCFCILKHNLKWANRLLQIFNFFDI